MPGVNRFVVRDFVVTDIPKVESREICALMGKGTVVSVLGIPMLGCTIDGL